MYGLIITSWQIKSFVKGIWEVIADGLAQKNPFKCTWLYTISRNIEFICLIVPVHAHVACHVKLQHISEDALLLLY